MVELLALLASAKKWPWKLIGCIALVLAVLAAIHFFGQSRYAQGVSDERAIWQEKLSRAEARANSAELRLQQDIASRSEQAHQRQRERTQIVTEARQEIANAQDTETRFAAYHALRERLRHDAAEHLARAGADYVSSLPS